MRVKSELEEHRNDTVGITPARAGKISFCIIRYLFSLWITPARAGKILLLFLW